MLKNAICNLLAQHAEGLRNSAIAQTLALDSAHEGRQKDYLTYSVLGLLLEEGRVQKRKQDGKVWYFVPYLADADSSDSTSRMRG